MKRTLFAASLALLTACASYAASADNLRYYYDFNMISPSGSAETAPNLAADKGGTAGAGSLASSAWANYTDADLAYEGDHAYRAQSNSANSLQLNFGAGEFSGGFTMSVMVRDYATWGSGSSLTTSSAQQYGRFLGLTDGSRIFYMQKATGSTSATGDWEQFCSNGNTFANAQAGSVNNLGGWASKPIQRDSYTNITVTMAVSETDSSLTTVSVYFDGQKLLTADTTLSLDSLSSLQFANANTAGSFDNLQIYNTALNDAEVGMLASNPTGILPEPATATLSALALAGMAIRRRRNRN